jgi:hypothetical protein
VGKVGVLFFMLRKVLHVVTNVTQRVKGFEATVELSCIKGCIKLKARIHAAGTQKITILLDVKQYNMVDMYQHFFPC